MSLGKKKKEKKSSPKIFVLKNAFIEITIFNGPPLEFRIRAWLSLNVKHFYFYQIKTKNNGNSVSIECKNRRTWRNIECSKYRVTVRTRIFIFRNKLQETENLLTKLISSSRWSSSSVININYHVLNIHDPYGTNGSLKCHGQSFNEIHGSSTQPYESWIYLAHHGTGHAWPRRAKIARHQFNFWPLFCILTEIN